MQASIPRSLGAFNGIVLFVEESFQHSPFTVVAGGGELAGTGVGSDDGRGVGRGVGGARGPGVGRGAG
jgi:hypothetical protein